MARNKGCKNTPDFLRDNPVAVREYREVAAYLDTDDYLVRKLIAIFAVTWSDFEQMVAVGTEFVAEGRRGDGEKGNAGHRAKTQCIDRLAKQVELILKVAKQKKLGADAEKKISGLRASLEALKNGKPASK